MSATLTYVYCLVRAAGPPSLRRIPAGVPGARSVRLIEVPPKARGPKPKAQSPKPKARDWLVVSSVPARQYDEAAVERGLQQLDWVGARALAHEAVVEYFLPAPVLPMQLFTLFTSDERAIQHIAADARRIARIFARIEGRLEWGLRVTVSRPVQGSDPRTARGRPSTRAQGAPSEVEGRGLTPRSGAEYLARKGELRHAGRGELVRARRDAERAYRAIKRTAAAARRRPEVEQAAPGSRVVLDAAFLVPLGGRRAFEAAVRRHARPLARAGTIVSLTGPWPAYNFI
ncbi:MAG: GvpL/GvpF family gas vesicle protein [Acidobacteria bacterium]|nr:GvpL/GvpF family gas vesicle protein [Acidobacteriota bacterium]